MEQHVLAVILARAGSKGLPNKNILQLAGRPIIAHTIDQARQAKLVDAVCVTTDAPEAAEAARAADVFVVDRPPHLATDTATVDAAARHAVETYEQRHGPVTHVVILYANVPIRAPGIIDRAVDHLLKTGCDSVRTLAPVSKQHPDWLHRLDGDRMIQFRKNSIYRRQDLEPLCYHDGAVLAVTRRSLFMNPPPAQKAALSLDDRHAFLGADRRGIVGRPADTIDIDTPDDLRLAEAMLAGPQQVASAPRGRREGETSSATKAQQGVTIGRKRIGENHPVYVIAEAGVNHDGNPDAAHRLIDAARQAGADAVKFQLFSADRLVAPSAPACAYQQEHDSSATQHDLLRRLELPPAVFPDLKAHAASLDLDFLATPFGLGELRFLLDLGVPALKIASPDIVNVPLLTAAVQAGLPLIVSTGAAELAEIDAAVQLVHNRDAAGCLVLLHCVSAYPTPPDQARLGCIAMLAARYGVPVGFSDHTADPGFSALAVTAGAAVLEKHLTLSRRAAGPDHFFSLEPDQFAAYVAAARAASAALGDGVIRISPHEMEVRRLARGSITTTRPIAAGQPLIADCLTVQRPGDGIPPNEWDRVLGRIAKTDIPPNLKLAWTMLS